MGEKIKNLAESEIRNGKVVIELNEGQNSMDSYDIHIEAPMFRYSMNDTDFMKFTSAVLEARKKLLYTKKLER